jgi:hypothetical protein
MKHIVQLKFKNSVSFYLTFNDVNINTCCSAPNGSIVVNSSLEIIWEEAVVVWF